MKKFKIRFYRECLMNVELYANTQEEAVAIFKKAPLNISLDLKRDEKYFPVDEIIEVKDVSSKQEAKA